MTFLWTDVCLLAVLFISLVVTLFSLRKAHVRQAFRRILHQPMSVSAGIVLLFFLGTGILDSIHIRPSSMAMKNNTMSDTADTILDYMLSPLGHTYEKTYSAPLALHLFSTETLFAGGKAKQVYPRLQYVSKSIRNDKEKRHRIRAILVSASGLTLSTMLVLWGILIGVHKVWRNQWRFKPHRGQIIPLITLFLCLYFAYSSYGISRDFHLLGTGKIGQDIFYYTLKSIRTGLVIGILTTLFMLPLALLFGMAAGYFGGVIDDIIQYVYTTLSSIPGVLLITASVLSMQTYIANHPERFATLSQRADARLFALCMILGVTSWTSLCRLLRAEALKLREIDYVLAARALGSSAFRILRKHILPNVMPIVLITLVLDFSFLVLAEAVLSYVGVGVSPMTISWGNMINGARLELAREPLVWWPMMAAFTFMFILVLASNLFADAMRDAFDPHQAINIT
ncbi:ABC transporter permease [Legionella spiritensis]|uniref:ABC transporter permease n=1 Tax=Legionella spiritensis TaxID=452 RepID=UPI000F71783A|nr:ABC transporter permease [Legionella spiritensis]VEG89876.1 peptide ABC transporter permease [Legionella spiritensis]